MRNMLSIFIVSCVIFLELLAICKKREKWLMSVPVVLWMAHTLIFYISLPNMTNVILINSWSHNLRLQGQITMLLLGAYRYIKYKKMKEVVDEFTR